MRFVPRGTAPGAHVLPQGGARTVAPLVLEGVAGVDLLSLAVVLAELALATGDGRRGTALQVWNCRRRRRGPLDRPVPVRVLEEAVEVPIGSNVLPIGGKVGPQVFDVLEGSAGRREEGELELIISSHWGTKGGHVSLIDKLLTRRRG